MKKIVDILGKAFIALFLGILILGLMMWGVGDIFRSSGPQTVAKVGNQEISSYELERMVNQSANQLSPDLPEDVRTKITNYFRQSALRYLVNRALIKNEIGRLGLKIDGTEIIKNEYLSLPNFDENNLSAMIRQEGGEKAFLEKITTQKKADFLESAITSTIPYTELGYNLIYKFDNQKRDIKYFELTKKNVRLDTETAQEHELMEYYEQNKEKFKAANTRNFTYILIDKSSLKNEVETQEGAEPDYYQAFSRINSYILDRLAEETSLEEIAKELDITLVKLKGVNEAGEQNGDQAKIPEIEGFLDIVFSLEEGIASDLLENENGDLYSVVIVDAVNEGKYKAFNEVRAKVNEKWRSQQKSKKFAAYISKLTEKIKNNEINFEKFANKNKFEIIEVENVYRGFPNLPQSFIDEIFKTNIGSIVAPQSTIEGKFIIGKVEAIYPPEGEDELEKLTTKSTVQEQITQELIDQYLVSLSRKYSITTNNPTK